MVVDRVISPREFVQAVSRHRKKLYLWSAVAIGLAMVAAVLLPRKYSSEAKLFIRLGRESVTLDPTATTGTTVQVQELRETQINSSRDLLQSRSLLEQVVKQLGPDAILNGKLKSDADSTGWMDSLSRCFDWIPSFSFSPSISPEEQAVAKLSKAIGIRAARNSSVIDVWCRAKSPKLAQLILNTFVDAYQQQHVSANHTAGSLKFFAEQSTALKKQLDEAMERLRKAKNESSLVSISAEQKALQDQILQVSAASFATNASLSSSEAAIERLQKAMVELPERLATQETAGIANVAADYMRQELFKLQINLREYEAKLGPEHPIVLAVREQAKQSEAIIKSQPTERVQTTTGINPSRQALDLDLRREMVAAAGLRAKSETLKEQIAVLQQRTRDLNDYEVQIAQLEQQTDIATTNYRNYVDHLEQARIGEALEAQQISNVNVVQPPTFVERPVSPNVAFVIGLGIVAALFGSVAIVFGYEYFDKSLRTAEEGERSLGLPVFASIPHARSEQHAFAHS